MSEIPDESRPGEGATATGEADLQTELKALGDWARHAALTGKDQLAGTGKGGINALCQCSD